MLNVIESFNLLKKLPVANYEIIQTEKDLSKINFPYYMKISSSGHKIDVGGVKKCNNLEEAKSNFQLMKKTFSEKIIIQKAIEGVEMIVGIKEDTVFDKLLMIGFGGTNAEVLKDVTFRTLPIDKNEIKKMLQELKLYRTLITRKKYAIDKFIELTENLSKLKIKEADFNPIILTEKDAWIVDSRIEN